MSKALESIWYILFQQICMIFTVFFYSQKTCVENNEHLIEIFWIEQKERKCIHIYMMGKLRWYFFIGQITWRWWKWWHETAFLLFSTFLSFLPSMLTVEWHLPLSFRKETVQSNRVSRWVCCTTDGNQEVWVPNTTLVPPIVSWVVTCPVTFVVYVSRSFSHVIIKSFLVF